MHVKRLLLGVLLAVPFFPACSSGSASEDATSSTGQSVSTNDIMARAQEWVNDGVPYCGGVRGGTDEICGGTCDRPSAAWNDFRSDCSGFVSWCWQIMDDPATSEYVSDRGGSQGWHTIAIDDLQAGDAIVTDGHIKLFSSFSGSSALDIFEEYDCGEVARETVQGFSRSGDSIYISGDSRTYHPIRRNDVDGPSTAPPSAPAVVESAFQANTGNLWTADSSGGHRWDLGMMQGTSPSIAALAGGGFEIAVQTNTGELWTVGDGGDRAWGLGMMHGTSPSIAALAGGGFQVAFQANTGELWTVGSAANGPQSLGMMNGTSPSITGLTGGGYEIAFQANTGELWTAGAAGTGSWKLGMLSGTSPAIVGLTGGSYEVAFQANNSDLWTIGAAGNKHWDLGMMPGSSPSITALSGNGYVAAMEANTTSLWTAGTNGISNWQYGMMSGTSPSVSVHDDQVHVVFQANTGDLWAVGDNGNGDQLLGMMSGTSPSGS
ncbi:MAG: hypothetical protein ABI183_00415 [Polyangiaceae bacterium]